MHLSKLLSGIVALPEAHASLDVGAPCLNSKHIQKNDVFFCENSTSYLWEAIHAGASAVIFYRTAPEISLPVPVFRVANVRESYALAWQNHTDHPEEKLLLYAVTGTNGKTSTAHFLAEIFRQAGYSVGEIGTLRSFDGKTAAPSDYTTPPPEILYPLLQQMAENGVSRVVMEASSHAIAQKRLYGLSFESVIFTNLTRDHLDYHGTFEAYLAAKASLMRQANHAILCLDDPHAMEIAFEAAGDVYYYGEHHAADFVLEDEKTDNHGISYRLTYLDERYELRFPLFGAFQIKNSAAALATARLSGLSKESIRGMCDRLTPPNGRLEELKIRARFRVFIDYAHTPDALEQSLRSLKSPENRLTVVFGAGGDRDPGKRPQMGEVADRLADRILLTNDNPRTEDPKKILADIRVGIRHTETHTIPDRRTAIELAMETARTGEIILLAGKGHEEYIIDENGKREFSERRIVRQYLERKGQENVSQHE